MIEIDDVHLHFGGIRAVDGASFSIEQGSITGLIGPNGAGKTTLFNVIAGHYKPTSGRVLLDSDDITGLPPHELFGRGLLRTFQIAHEFTSLTVRENLMMVPGGQSGESLLDAWLRPSKVAAEEERNRDKANEVIDFLEIGQVADELAGNLSGGQKKLRTRPNHDGRRENRVSGRSGRRGESHATGDHHRLYSQTSARAWLHFLRHRARYGNDPKALRPGCGDGRGKGALRGHAGRSHVQRTGDRSLSGHGP